MDPASILGLIATAGTIAGAITKTIKDLSELRGTYTDANIRIRLLIKELSTIKSSLTQINDWAHFLDYHQNQEDLRDALQVALDGVELAMGALADEVSGLVPQTTATARVELGFRAKTKYAWNEQNMKEHENRLRAQVSALQLLLQAAQCATRPEQAELLRAPQSRKIIQKVAEDSVTLRATMSAAGSLHGPPTIQSHEDSTIDGKIFDWDDDIVNAATYRRALHHHISKSKMPANAPMRDSSSDIQIHIDPGLARDSLLPPPSPTPSADRRPLPYENSIISEPVQVSGPGRSAYLPLSSRSDGATDHPRPLAQRFKSADHGKKNFWSSLAPRRSHHSSNPPTPTTPSSGMTPSSPSPGSYRGRRGFENSSHTSIDFGSEKGLSAPAIVRAAQAGSVVEVEMLLDQGADVEAVHQQSGRNGLAVASHCGNESVVQLLLQYGPNVNTRDASSLCPLHLAALRGHVRVVELLLQEHARVDEPGPYDETPLRIASDKGYVEVADLLLRARAKVNARDRRGMKTPLHVAAQNGDERMTELLIKHGAHMEAKDSELMTPLHYACEAGKERVVALLLTKKAGLEILGRRGMTPLVCAAAAGQNQVLDLLLKKKAYIKHHGEGDMTALHWASYNGHYEVVNTLLEKRASPNVVNRDGRAALHLAILGNHFAVAELLLRKGAAVETPCKAMSRPIHYACKEGSPELVQLLLGYHADVEVESSGRRPLHHAAAQGLIPIVNALLTRGVEIDARDAAGDRALGLASRMGHLLIVRSLLDRGSRMRLKFAKGPSHEDSPLCLAAQGGHVAIVRELMARGSSILQKDEQNWSPLRYASHYAHPEVVELLLEAGATIAGQPSGGWGFDVTAHRIGFADEVRMEVQRKAKVLELLTHAEARERESQEEATAPSLTLDPVAPQKGGVPVELASGMTNNNPTSTAVKASAGASAPSTAENAATDQNRLSELDTRQRSPSGTSTSDAGGTKMAYPSPSHIANAFGFDPFPHQYSGTAYGSGHGFTPNNGPKPKTPASHAPTTESVVHLGPDGLWRLNPMPGPSGADGSASIYEMGG
ncbi:MAG: hypothetical protein Q9220_001716 [cf. Caloplaca sp. 1 TL-2023]